MIWNTPDSLASRSLRGVLFSLILLTPTAQAATWICGDGNWNWNGLPNASCWDWWDYPDTGEEVWIVDTIYAASKSVTYINPGYNPTLKGLYINSNSGTASKLIQSQDELTVMDEQVGADGQGSFLQYGGKHTVTNNLYLGHLSGSNGIYDLSKSGELSTANTYVGYAGWGEFDQHDADSDHDVTNDLYLGHANGSRGKYSLFGGHLATQNTYVGYEGEGSFYCLGENAADHVISNTLYLGYKSTATGYYRTWVYSRTVADTAFIGYEGRGTFEHFYGAVNITDTVNLGSATGSDGSYILREGRLTTARLHVGSLLDGHGVFLLVGGDLSVIDEIIYRSGVFTHESGTHSVSGGLVINSGGEYSLQGGDLDALEEILSEKTDTGPAMFTQTGGENNVSGNLYIGKGSNAGLGRGEYALQLGSLFVGENEYIGMSNSGVFTQTGGTHLVQNTLLIGAFSPAGLFNMQGGTLEVNGVLSIGSNGNMELSDGTINANTVDLPNARTFNFIGGKLTAFTIQGRLENIRGTLAPGGAPGLLAMWGGYTQLSGGTLQIELGGVTRGTQHDAVNVTGNLVLGGTLQVAWRDGFSAALGDSFDILDWQSVLGTFDTLSLPALSTGLGWDTSKLYIDGSLVVGKEQSIFADGFE